MPSCDPQPWTLLAKSCPELLGPGQSPEPTPKWQAWHRHSEHAEEVRWTRASYTETCLACRQVMQLLAEAHVYPRRPPYTKGQRGQAVSPSDPRATLRAQVSEDSCWGGLDMQRTHCKKHVTQSQVTEAEVASQERAQGSISPQFLGVKLKLRYLVKVTGVVLRVCLRHLSKSFTPI